MSAAGRTGKEVYAPDGERQVGEQQQDDGLEQVAPCHEHDFENILDTVEQVYDAQRADRANGAEEPADTLQAVGAKQTMHKTCASRQSRRQQIPHCISALRRTCELLEPLK